MNINPFVWFLLIGGIMSGTLTIYVWWRKTAAGSGAFALMMAAVTMWSLAYAVELASADTTVVMFALRMEYLGIVSTPVCWLVFVLAYTDRAAWLTTRRLVALCLIPVLVLLLNLTNDWHFLYYRSVVLDISGPYPLLALTPGPWYWVNVVYGWSLFLTGIWLLSRFRRQSPRLHRREAATLIAATLVPLVANAIYLAGGRPFGHVDLTPTSLVITGALLYWALFHYRLLDARPIAMTALFAQLRDGVLVINERHTIIDCNPAAQRMLALSDSPIGQQAEQALQHWPELHQFRGAADPTDQTRRLTRGQSLAVDMRCITLRDREGAPNGRMLVLYDVSEQWQAEQALQEERRLFIGGPTVIFRWSVGTNMPVVYVSPNIQTQFGYLPEDFTEGRIYFASVVHPEDRDQTIADMQRYIESGAAWFEQEYRVIRADGEVRWIHDYNSTTCDEHGAVIQIHGYVHDVTEKKRVEFERLELERQLQHTQKLESLGVLSSGIAHDYNNLLMAMNGHLELANLMLPDDAPARQSVQSAIDAARRAAELTRQLMAYTGQGVYRLTDVNLSVLVNGMVDLLHVSLNKDTQLELQLADSLPTFTADAAQVQQIILNLTVNAAEALAERAGRIRVRTYLRDCDEAFLARNRIEARPAPGRYVALEITDNGCGMDETTQRRMFEPFFSTKFLGRGLGMAAVLGIVRGHHGAIIVDSAHGQGTTVTVLFPLGVTTLNGMPHAPKSAHSAGAVLIVDDDTDIRNVTARMLKHLGYTVLTAADGATALQLVEQELAAIGCVLLDLKMPGMDGPTTLAGLRSIAPHMAVVLSSGYPGEEVAQHYAHLQVAGYIQKPYDLRELREVIEQTTAAPLRAAAVNAPAPLSDADATPEAR